MKSRRSPYKTLGPFSDRSVPIYQSTLVSLRLKFSSNFTMGFCIYFYSLLLLFQSNFLNSQALSVGDNDLPELPDVPLENESKDSSFWNTLMTEGSNLMSSKELDSVRKSFNDESSSSFGVDVIKPVWTSDRELAWWPSKVDRFVAVRKDISEEREGSLIVRENLKDNKKPVSRITSKQPATVEDLENRNANIYNPLLNLDHYPIPYKKYTVIELENMNANRYNPYL